MRTKPSWLLLPSAATEEIAGELRLSERYHEASKYHRALLFREGPQPAPGQTPPPPECTIALPAAPCPEMSLGEVLARRRSHRRFAATPLGLEALSALLGRAFGVGAYPSAGALYGVSVLILARGVAGLRTGFYRYRADLHALVPHQGEVAGALASLLPPGERHEIEAAPLFLFLTATFAQMQRKYGERGYRFCLQECGHMAQNAQLIAAALGLGSLVMAAYIDDELHRALGLNPVEQGVLTVMPVGWSAEQSALAEKGWLYLRIELPDAAQYDDVLLTALAPVLSHYRATGDVLTYWYLLKHDTAPHIRLRLFGQVALLRQTVLPAIVQAVGGRLGDAAGAIRELIYEPETELFGGPWALQRIHDLFGCDSQFVLAWAARSPAERGGISDYQISLLMQQRLLVHAELDAFERWDVWQKVAQLRPGSAEELAELWAQQHEAMELLLRVDLAVLTAALPSQARSALEAYDEALRRIGSDLAFGQRTGHLKRALRPILAIAICFHWNRMQFAGEEQAALAYLMSRATAWEERDHPP